MAAYAHIFPQAATKPTTAALIPSWTDLLIDPMATVIVAEDTVVADGGTADGGMADGGAADGVDDGRPGGVVGGVVVRTEPAAPCGFLLERLYVDPSRWGSGIGGMLHDAAVRAARRHGACGVNLWVLVQNHRARAMYERRGWRLVAGEQLAHTSPPITEVRYELDLPDDVDLPDELDRADDVELLQNEEGPARASRSFVPRETMLGGTCSTSTTLSVGERALSDHRAIRPIRRLAAASRPARRIG